MNTQYEAAFEALGKTVDGLGMEIDSEIRHTVAALNAAGFVTTASYAGHLDHGLPYPWIDIGEQHFAGDLKHTPKFLESFRNDLEEVAEKHIIGDESGLSAYVNQGHRQYIIIAGSDHYKRLYINNMDDTVVTDSQRKNIKMAQTMYRLLEGYYTANRTAFPFMLSIQNFHDSTYRLQHNIASIMPSLSKSKQRHLHKECLDHINAFADYIAPK